MKLKIPNGRPIRKPFAGKMKSNDATKAAKDQERHISRGPSLTIISLLQFSLYLLTSSRTPSARSGSDRIAAVQPIPVPTSKFKSGAPKHAAT